MKFSNKLNIMKLFQKNVPDFHKFIPNSASLLSQEGPVKRVERRLIPNGEMFKPSILFVYQNLMVKLNISI